MMDDPARIPPIDELAVAMEFNPGDLAANRQEQLSPNQIEHLRRLQRRAVLIGAAGFLILTLLATIFLYIGQTGGGGILTLIGIFLTFCDAILVSMMARHWYRLSADIRDGAVVIRSGLLTRTLRRAGNSSQYLVGIGDVRFPVKKEAFRTFRHEALYTLYYAPHAHILLTAEPANV
ncbi:MAG: hypothetical protein KC546_09645 [Anaerolineae bacterium]|nr:hypothetical protein [Anaerolineae bacterium]